MHRLRVRFRSTSPQDVSAFLYRRLSIGGCDQFVHVLASSCSRSRIRRAYSLTAVPSAKISRARSTKCRFQSPTESGCTPYALATCPSVFSPESTSSITCAFRFGVYRRRAMPTSFRSARFHPVQHRARRSNVTKGRCPGSGGHIREQGDENASHRSLPSVALWRPTYGLFRHGTGA